ncbi:MAG: DUF1990 family protein [Thermoleophilaceae bacterium]
MLDWLLLGQPRDPGQALAELRRRKLNFDVSRRTEYTPQNGWHADEVRQALPPEPPGAPSPGGSWETARAIARNYDFADPSIVRGVFDHGEPLERRTMLLILHFHRLRIFVGVRVGDVYDEERTLDGRRGRVFGWNYRTLEGHVEQGEMNWEVWKFPETGDVLFRVSSFSRPAPRSNLLVRIGFRLFGRREQLRFLALTANRMAQLTEKQVTHRTSRPTP